MRKVSNVILYMLIFISSSCEDENPGKGLLLVNNSNFNVYFYNSEDFTNGHFPDTLLPSQRPIGLQFIKANGKSGKYVNPDWDYRFSLLPEGKFSVYVLSANEVDNLEWIDIQNSNLVLKRFDLTLEDLKSSDYTITFDED